MGLLTTEEISDRWGDWWEVFKYAADVEAVPEGCGVDASGFTTADVERVELHSDGENEGPDWIAAGLLRDGRWFYVSAGCDYTGWG